MWACVRETKNLPIKSKVSEMRRLMRMSNKTQRTEPSTNSNPHNSLASARNVYPAKALYIHSAGPVPDKNRTSIRGIVDLEGIGCVDLICWVGGGAGTGGMVEGGTRERFAARKSWARGSHSCSRSRQLFGRRMLFVEWWWVSGCRYDEESEVIMKSWTK